MGYGVWGRAGVESGATMGEQAYRKLEAWQVAMDLVEAVYRVSRRFPEDERFGLIAQVRRAAMSIPNNIAEGYGRIHRGDYVHHLSMARGSLMEVETSLIVAVRLGFASREDAAPIWDLLQRTGKLLTQLIRSLGGKIPPTTDSPPA